MNSSRLLWKFFIEIYITYVLDFVFLRVNVISDDRSHVVPRSPWREISCDGQEMPSSLPTNSIAVVTNGVRVIPVIEASVTVANKSVGCGERQEKS